MADVTPKLEKNTRTTMPNLGKVRRVVVPPGTRTLWIGLDAPAYWETPAAEKADDAAEDATSQLYLVAGDHPLPLTGSGEADVPFPLTAAAQYVYFVPTVAGQVLTVRPTKVA